MEQGRADTNPVIGTTRHKERERARVLTPAELRSIWSHAGNDDFGSIVRLLALTGQRAGEISGLRYEEILDAEIALPAERTKNGEPHVVPLSSAALAVLAQCGRRGDREFVFGRGKGGFTGRSKAKDRLDERIAKANGGKPISPWTLHDLRRTFATYAGGGPAAVQLAQFLNHVSGTRGGVAGTYNRSTYETGKRIALDRWADHLTAIIEGRASNVTPLRARAEA
jgi:integrase